LIEIMNNLLRKGVKIPNSAAVDIGPEVDLRRISGDGVVIHPGCRIHGEQTLILAGSRLGSEGPVTVENCFIGPQVELKSGFFREAVFLQKAACGLGAHVREGTILEEHAGIAHTVGLKQTILFPFVTLGSLINFCDCLMAGGTDRRNHSEVGSSYIHFNFTPNQDKATPSLIGDVPRGVMLNQRPIFLGGQGGLVGPVRLGYGITVAAGTIVRKDELRPDRLIFGGVGQGGNVEFGPGRFSGTGRIVKNNLIYIANLIALRHWYREVRSLFVGKRFPEPLLVGLLLNLQKAIDERTGRLKELGDKMAASGDPSLYNRWAAIGQVLRDRLEQRGDDRLRESFQGIISEAIASYGKDYLEVIKGLSGEEASQGTAWLQGIVDTTVEAALGALK
jgi:bifunctional UDP-N-acetylglucosamine pyrophosphorylase / glucosamine-1-phosphate N-acetyltransferase